MGTKGWIIFGVITAAVLGTLVYLSGQNRIDVSGYNLEQIIAADEKNGQIGDNVFGNKESKVILIEYGDFQCPGCGSAYPQIKEITEKYEDKIAFIFRNLPLTSIHPNARAAAAAAQAAGKQNKYWEMHNLLYEKQDEWEGVSADERGTFFETYAKSLGLDLEQFKTDVSSESIAQKINFDLSIAKEKKFTSTPTFTLNGEVIDLYVKDGALVDSGTTGAQPIWTDTDLFEKEVIIPALEKAGIELLPESTE